MKKLQIPLLTTSLYLLSTSTVFAQLQDTARNLTAGPGGETKVDITSQLGGFFGFTCITNFVFRIVDISIILAGLILFVFLVWGGIEWLTSGGDKGKIEAARAKLTNALIGVAIIAASYAVWQLALVFFGIDVSTICTKTPIPG